MSGTRPKGYETAEIVSCKNCGQRYYKATRHYPMRDRDEQRCEKCEHLMDRWSGSTVPDYLIVEDCDN